MPAWAGGELRRMGPLSRREITFGALVAIELPALLLCLQLGIMGIITPFASGPSPIYYGSGYLPSADYWRLGAIFGLIFLLAFMVIGVPWVLFIA